MVYHPPKVFNQREQKLNNGMETGIRHKPLEHFLCPYVTRLRQSSLFALPMMSIDMPSRFLQRGLAEKLC